MNRKGRDRDLEKAGEGGMENGGSNYATKKLSDHTWFKFEI
jgi:hypothetical protein